MHNLIILSLIALVYSAVPSQYPLPIGELPANVTAPNDLTGKIVVITGATSGVGYGIALEYIDRNATVIGTSRYPENYDLPWALYKLDYEDKNSIDKFWKELTKDYPHVDIFHHNGIRVDMGHALDFAYDDDMTSLGGLIAGPKYLMDKFIRTSDPTKKFTVVISLSLAGFNGVGQILSTYEASKVYWKSFARDWRFWYGPKYYPHVVVLAVACNNVNSSIIKNAYQPSALMGDEYAIKGASITQYYIENFGSSPREVGEVHVRAATGGVDNFDETLYTAIRNTSLTGSETYYDIYVNRNTTDYVDLLHLLQGSAFNITWPEYPSAKRSINDHHYPYKYPMDPSIGL